MSIYALLKGLDETNSFHGITSDDAVADTWTAAADENFNVRYEAFDNGTYHEVQADPVVYPCDDDDEVPA